MTLRKLSRRSFLGEVTGGAFAGATALVMLSGEAGAVQAGGNRSRRGSNARGHDVLLHMNDSDKSDRKRGVGRRREACSDNDRGAGADRARHGRRCQGRPG